MRFLKRINMYKKILPTKFGKLLWRLKRNYSWRSLIRDVALAVAETGSSWCVYSCTLKSVGTDFWGRDNWASFFTTLKAASHLSEHASAAVVEDWVNWLQTRASFQEAATHMKPCCLKYKTVGSLQACCGSPVLLTKLPADGQWWRMFLGLGAFVNELLNSPFKYTHRLYWNK